MALGPVKASWLRNPLDRLNQEMDARQAKYTEDPEQQVAPNADGNDGTKPPFMQRLGSEVGMGAAKVGGAIASPFSAIGTGTAQFVEGLSRAQPPSLVTPFNGQRYKQAPFVGPTAPPPLVKPIAPTQKQAQTPPVPPAQPATATATNAATTAPATNAPRLLAPQSTIGGNSRMSPSGFQNLPATNSQISLLKGGKEFLGDVADIQQYAGPNQQVKGAILPRQDGLPSSSVAYVTNKNPVADAKPLEGQARYDLLNKVGGGGVLRSNQTEVSLLDRMRREGARGSASNRDQAAQAQGIQMQQQVQQYDMFGKRMAADQAAQQQQLIEAQGRASAMPAAEQARGAIGAATEQAKSAQSSLQAAQEYRKEEKDSDRQARLQLALQTSYERQGQRATEAESKRHLSQSNTFEKAFSQETMDPVKQLGQLSGVVQSMKDANHPDWKTHRDTVFQTIALPMATQIAPKATPQQQDAIAKVLVGNGGNVNKLPPELLSLVTVK